MKPDKTDAKRDVEDLRRVKSRVIGEEAPLCPREEPDLHQEEQTERNLHRNQHAAQPAPARP